MNEKLKEIAIRAKIQMVSEPRLIEFADLIIAECANTIENINKSHARTTYDLDTVQATIERCSNDVKALFK